MWIWYFLCTISNRYCGTSLKSHTTSITMKKHFEPTVCNYIRLLSIQSKAQSENIKFTLKKQIKSTPGSQCSTYLYLLEFAWCWNNSSIISLFWLRCINLTSHTGMETQIPERTVFCCSIVAVKDKIWIFASSSPPKCTA